MSGSIEKDSSKDVDEDYDRQVSILCELIQGTTLLKAGRSGKPHFRRFYLADDLQRLMWESSRKGDAAVLISEIIDLKLGQTTQVFQKNPLPQCEAVSFSLLYSDRSLDLVCKDKKEFETWTAGLRLLLDGFKDIQAVTDKLEELGTLQGADKDRIQVQLGTMKTKVFLNESSLDLYMWGLGGRGRLGHKGDESEFIPRIVESFLGHSVVMLACGNGHTLALSGDGRVFSWGAGHYGHLGHGNLRDRYGPLWVDRPLRGVKVTDIACYECHSAAISDTGELYTWGKAGPYLGYVIESGKTKQMVPRKVDKLSGKKIVQVVCGRWHTLVCCDAGQVYSFGQNKFGELGLGTDREVEIPTVIPNLPPISKITCGRHHSAAIDDDGVLWMWGWGSKGQLGTGELKSLFTPKAIDGFNNRPVDDVSCGYGHTAAVTAMGVYCWGDNGYGQCGVPSTAVSERLTPHHVPISGTQPYQVSCGANYTVMITSQGQLYTWGCGLSGQLGHGESRRSTSQPIAVDVLAGKKVKVAACGEEHMGCLVLHGWVPDEEAHNCMACKKSFTPIRRRHHCRACGGIYCGSCSSKSYPLLDKGFTSPVRVCDKCYVSLSAPV